MELNAAQWALMWYLHDSLQADLDDVARMPRGDNKDALDRKLRLWIRTLEDILPKTSPSVATLEADG